MPPTRLAFAAFAAALSSTALLTYSPAASACACCSETGERVEGTNPLDRPELDRVRFAKRARLFTDASGMAGIKGIIAPTDTYELTQTRTGDRWTFTFKDTSGRIGTLTFTLPQTVDKFSVDPQEGATPGGPLLYKEWRIASNATTGGDFAPASRGGAPNVRLVLQGRGNSCTSAEQFKSYSLIVSGPSASFTIFGRLDAPAALKP